MSSPEPFEDIDTLCVNTIRTLSIDAIQKANSGHPGTPMAMAPVAYTLWQRFLRFDPSDPIWPNRDRFVLSAGHASMLLYALLHLSRVRAVDPDYEVVGEPSVSLDDIKTFRQLDSKAAGHPEYRWTSGVESTTGPLGPGHRDQRGDGGGRALAGPALQPAGVPSVRLRRLRAVRRRLPDGGRVERGRLVRRPRAAREPLLDLRQQPHHDRRPHRDHLHGRRRHAVHGIRLERAPGRRRQRPRSAGERVRGVPRRGAPPDPDHRRQPHRLRLAAQAGHRRRARRAAGPRGGPRDQARLRLARGRRVPRARRRLRALRGGDRGAGREAARRVGGAHGLLPARARHARAADRQDAAPRASRRLGQRHPLLRRRPEGRRHPQGLERRSERDRPTGPVAARAARRT